MAVGPSSVVVRGTQKLLTEGRQARLECEAVGAYPSAVITWEKTDRGGKSALLKAKVSIILFIHFLFSPSLFHGQINVIFYNSPSHQ